MPKLFEKNNFLFTKEIRLSIRKSISQFLRKDGNAIYLEKLKMLI